MRAAIRQILFGGGQRKFDISPAVGGFTTWNLDTQGPCTLTAGDWTLTPRPGFSANFKLWGPGGGSGGVGATTKTDGGNSTPATSFSRFGVALVGNAGTGSAGVITNGPGNGKAGATATGGDINTTGGSGTAGTIAATCIGGNGGAAPNGGAVATGASAGSGVSVAGVAGNYPGGGAAGAVHGDATAGNRRAAGGAAAGGYCEKTYAKGELSTGVGYLVRVGVGGTAGTGDEANGAAGADGKVIIT